MKNHFVTLRICLILGLTTIFSAPALFDNLDGVRKVFGDKIPDPFGAIADDHLLLRTAPTALPRFSIDAFAKLHRGFDGPGVGVESGSPIA